MNNCVLFCLDNFLWNFGQCCAVFLKLIFFLPAARREFPQVGGRIHLHAPKHFFHVLMYKQKQIYVHIYIYIYICSHIYKHTDTHTHISILSDNLNGDKISKLVQKPHETSCNLCRNFITFSFDLYWPSSACNCHGSRQSTADAQD